VAAAGLGLGLEPGEVAKRLYMYRSATVTVGRDDHDDDVRPARASAAPVASCHSRECHERLPPSPALSRSMAGLKKRLFLYGPAHRAQMLAKAQGGRVLALRKVGAELYLGAQ
jgi:hypothetical protein